MQTTRPPSPPIDIMNATALREETHLKKVQQDALRKEDKEQQTENVENAKKEMVISDEIGEKKRKATAVLCAAKKRQYCFNMHSLTTEQSIRLLECIGVKGIRDAIIASGEEFDGDYLCGIDTEEDFKDFLSEVKLEVSKLRLKALFKKFKRYQDGEEAIPESVLSAKDSVATASSSQSEWSRIMMMILS